MSSGVSVVIPVFNGANYLAAAIESVLAQTYPAAAIIVVDDGSEDGTPDVARRFASRIIYLRQENGGLSAARNAGQALVTTDLLAFLDADDVWCPRKLEWQVPHLAGGPAMVFGHTVQFISPDLSAEECALLKCNTAPMPAYCGSSIVLHNRSFAAVGGFDPAFRIGEFMEFYARAEAAKIKPVMLPQVVFHRRLHKTNMGRRERHRRSDYAKAFKAILDLKRAQQ
jgi:glycosyltransferase involved in cell wall biosynthesis